MQPKFKRGDSVKHKILSDSPVMMVESYLGVDEKNYKFAYHCCWISKDGNYHDAMFGEDELQKG